MEYPTKIKLIVNTPKNQAERSIKTQRIGLLGHKQSEKIIEEKIVNDHQFYWIIKINDQKDQEDLIKKTARGETMIRAFYSTLFKLISRANKVVNKFQKGTQWIKRWMINKLRRNNQLDFIEKVESMTDEEIKDFLNITDKEEMKKFLEGSLIEIEHIKSLKV